MASKEVLLRGVPYIWNEMPAKLILSSQGFPNLKVVGLKSLPN